MSTFAVVIPAKNEEDFLPSLLASIKKQTLQPDEIVLADAGSTDQTRHVAEAAGLRVVDGGLPGPGRNAGAQASMSDIIFFIDADVELFDEHFFETALKDFTSRNLGVATFDLYLVEGSGLQQFGHKFYNFYVRLWGKYHPHAMGACIMVRRSVHDMIRGFDPTVLFCEDHDYGQRANKIAKFGVINGTMIGVTDRRLTRDGQLMVVLKYVLAECYIMLFGPIRTNWFKYEFGYRKSENAQR